MNNNPQSTVNSLHWPSLAQCVLSVLAILSCWGLALLFLALGVFFQASGGGGRIDTLSLFVFALSNLVGGFLVLPSAVFSLARLLRRPIPLPGWFRSPRLGWVPPALLIFLFPLMVYLGDRVAKAETMAWLQLPPVHLLAAGLPILFIIFLGRRKLPTGSPQRAWGVFASGLVLGPSVILVLELFVFVLLMITLGIYITNQPGLLQEISSQIRPYAPDPFEDIAQITQPYLLRPAFIFGVFAFVAGLVPLIEEIFKPIGVWFLAGRDLSPAEGFTAGLLSGTGYALFENFLISGTGGDWAVVMVTRVGTSLLHVTTAGLTGWALAVAWKKKRYWLLALAYLLAVLLHAAWNTTAILTAVPSLPLLEGYPETVLKSIGVAAYVVLGLLAALLFIILVGSNLFLRRGEKVLHQSSPVLPDGVQEQGEISGEPVTRSADASNSLSD